MADRITLPGTGLDYFSELRGGAWAFNVLSENADTQSVDAIGRFRSSEARAVFDSKFLTASKLSLLWDEATISGGGMSSTTPTVTAPYLDMQSTASTAGHFVRQTLTRFVYQQSQQVLISGVLQLTPPGTGVIRRWGLYDDDNGIFLEDNEGAINLVLRSSVSGAPVEIRVAQADWNVDKFDGTQDPENRSGVLGDWNQGQIMALDFQWGYGRVRVGFEVFGRIWYAHVFSFANVFAVPWASTPNLPIRYELITTGASPASELRQLRAVVLREGAASVGGDLKYESTPTINATTAGTLYAFLGLRHKAGQLSCEVDIGFVTVLTLSNDDFEWIFVTNPTVAGTFTYVDKPDSCVQVAIGDNTNIVTGGVAKFGGYGAKGTSIQSTVEDDAALGFAIDGTPSETVLCYRPISTNANARASISWRERV